MRLIVSLVLMLLITAVIIGIANTPWLPETPPPEKGPEKPTPVAGQDKPQKPPDVKPPVNEPALWTDGHTVRGDLKLSFLHARVRPTKLLDSLSGRETESQDKHLNISLRATNQNAERFLDWEGLGGFSNDTKLLNQNLATLDDDKGNYYRRISFEFGTSVAGRATDHRIRPGQTVEDILVFEPPVAAASSLTLTLPAPNGKDKIKILIPVSSIANTPQQRAADDAARAKEEAEAKAEEAGRLEAKRKQDEADRAALREKLEKVEYNVDDLVLRKPSLKISDDGLAITGTITNRRKVKLNRVEVTFEVFDARGKLLGEATAKNTGLPSGGLWPFTARFKGPFASYKIKELSGAE